VRKVAIVISELRPGGAERVVVHLAGALADSGVQPVVICLQRQGVLAEELLKRGLPVVALESMTGYDFRAILHLARLLRDLAPDVINVHDRASLPYVHLANRLAGRRPIVLSCHGLLLDSSTLRWVDRLALRGVQALTAVSQQTADVYARLLNWPEKITVVPNGVPAAAFAAGLCEESRAALGLAPDAFAFLAVGNIKPEKGFEDLIQAAAVLASRAGIPPFTVLIAGGRSDEAYAARLDELLRQRCPEGTVRLLGYRPDAAALYAASDAFVLPSRTEGLPMVLLEAMAAGKAVVTTAVGGIPGVVCDGVSGLLVEPAAPDRLADAMGRVLGDGRLRASLGDAARRTAEAEFGLSSMARHYLDVYQRVAAPAARPRVVMLGPLPPLTGGMATVADNLRRGPLADRCRLAVLNNGKMTPEGRHLLVGIATQAAFLGCVIRAIRRIRAQIVHIHTCALFSFWRDIAHMLVARALGCRVIWHIHDGSFEGFLRNAPPVRKAILRWALRMGSRIIVLSSRARDTLQPMEPAARWTIVQNGVAIPPVKDPSPLGAVRFLFLGNLTTRKGAWDLVDAAEGVFRKGLDITVRLAGGEVLPGQRDDLRRHIESLDCRDRITLLGVVSGAEKDRALAQSDCLVLPSYAEGLPMAVLEGMAYGLPVIATRIGAIPEAVTEGREGFLVEPGDVKALEDRVAQVAADRELRRLMGQAARAKAEERYSLKAVSDQIFSLYQEAIEGKGGTGS